MSALGPRLSSNPLDDPQHDRIVEEAARWHERSYQERSAAERVAFEEWLARDQRHGAAYDRLARVSADAVKLGHLRALADADARFPSWHDRILERLRWFARPAPLLGGALAAVVLVLAVNFVPNALQAAPQYATQIAEIEPLSLPDGTIVTLGADSAVDTDFSEASRREVTLRSGQAFFEVAPNAERPFYVLAGDVSIRVVGTKFDVRRGENETTISVLEGSVRVSSEDGQRTSLLYAGERAVIYRRQLFSLASAPAPTVATVPATYVAAWREGRLSYEDAPLSEVVADLNRYYGPGVRLATQDLGQVRVTTSFPTDEVEGFLSDLGSALPVRAEKQENGAYRIAARDERR